MSRSASYNSRGGNDGGASPGPGSNFGAFSGLPTPQRSPQTDRASKVFRERVALMRQPLLPLVNVVTAQPHPAFPENFLCFWLLTDAQLDELAHFYNQATPMDPHWRQYPCPVNWAEDLTTLEKRRKFGKFIGLRGCDTPIKIMTEEEIMAEARLARLAEEEEMWRRKRQWY